MLVVALEIQFKLSFCLSCPFFVAGRPVFVNVLVLVVVFQPTSSLSWQPTLTLKPGRTGAIARALGAVLCLFGVAFLV